MVLSPIVIVVLLLFVIMVVAGVMRDEAKGGSTFWFHVLIGVAVLAYFGLAHG